MATDVSRTRTIRIDSTVLEALERDWQRKGYRSLNSYIRAIVEGHVRISGSQKPVQK